MENIKTDEELLQMYANAKATCSCGGHHKGAQNERLQREYAEELKGRGIYVPASLEEKWAWEEQGREPNVTIPEGKFNGPGSY